MIGRSVVTGAVVNAGPYSYIEIIAIGKGLAAGLGRYFTQRALRAKPAQHGPESVAGKRVGIDRIDRDLGFHQSIGHLLQRAPVFAHGERALARVDVRHDIHHEGFGNPDKVLAALICLHDAGERAECIQSSPFAISPHGAEGALPLISFLIVWRSRNYLRALALKLADHLFER